MTSPDFLRASVRRALALVAGLFVFLTASSHAEAAKYTVAVVPQFPAVEIHRNWAPLLAELSERTGHEFVLTQFKTIPEFEASFLRGTPDFVFLNPYHMVMAAKAQRYRPIVREGQNLLSGVLVVASDSAFKSLDQLQRQTLAFPAPNAFGASLYMRALLAERGIQIKSEFVGTHGNAYRSVLAGQTVAAGGIKATLERESPEIRAQLRVLFETPAVPAHPFAAHPRVPQADVGAVMGAWLELARSPVHQTLLKGVAMPNPVAADYKKDYAPLERLKLDEFAVSGGD